MRVVVKGVNAQLAFINVVLSIDKLTRQYTIKETTDTSSFSIGDSVSIYDDDEILLIKGDIEYLSVEDERRFVYAGRNDAKYIVDSYAERTVQFSKSQSVQSVLSTLASSSGVNVSGPGFMPKDTIKTVLVGANLGDEFMSIAKSTGNVLTSDAVGDIHIEHDGETGDANLVYGENIRSRVYKHDTTKEYDRYKVVSQSNFLTSQEQLSDVWGEYGSGSSVRVIRSSDNLTAQECAALAKKLFNLDRRKSLYYQVEVDRSLGLEINKIYPVLDSVVGINETMRVKELKFTIEDGADVVLATLERAI